MGRRYGVPKTDVERAMSHYGITEAEYCANPEAYPLPTRGTRVKSGSSGTNWGLIALFGVLILALTRRR